MPNLKHEEAALARAKTLIQAKRYEDAVKVLAPLKSDKARAWMGKLNSMGFEYEAPKPAKAKTGTEGVFRVVWGIATLLSCGWIALGFAGTNYGATQTLSSIAEATPMLINGTPVPTIGAELGVVVGSGIGITMTLCTGVPLFLFFLFLFWRAGVGIRNKRQHAEQLNAMRGL